MSNDYYYSVYKRRLNRYGLDYQSRIQSQREREFDNYLYKTIYRVDFEFERDWHPASLEHYKQDHSEIQCYLLTKIDLKIPAGTVLNIESRDGKKTPYMVLQMKWRRKRDLNPRALLQAYELSKPTPSATWVFLQRVYFTIKMPHQIGVAKFIFL